MLSGSCFKDVSVPGSTVVPMPEMDTSFSLGGGSEGGGSGADMRDR